MTRKACGGGPAFRGALLTMDLRQLPALRDCAGSRLVEQLSYAPKGAEAPSYGPTDCQPFVSR